MHVGVDNLNVVRHVGRLWEEVDPVKPLILMDDVVPTSADSSESGVF